MENVTGELVKDLQSQGKKLLVQITGVWCGPCKQLTPRLENMENDYPNVKFVKVDVDQEKDYINQLRISSVPTVLIYNGIDLVDRSMGLKTDKYYKDFLNLL